MMRKICEAALLFVGTLGWWGFVYPELCPDGEVYQEEAGTEEVTSEREAVSEEKADSGEKAASGEPVSIWESGWQLGEIRIKSRLMEYVCQIRETPVKEKRLEDEE